MHAGDDVFICSGTTTQVRSYPRERWLLNRSVRGQLRRHVLRASSSQTPGLPAPARSRPMRTLWHVDRHRAETTTVSPSRQAKARLDARTDPSDCRRERSRATRSGPEAGRSYLGGNPRRHRGTRCWLEPGRTRLPYFSPRRDKSRRPVTSPVKTTSHPNRPKFPANQRLACVLAGLAETCGLEFDSHALQLAY